MKHRSQRNLAIAIVLIALAISGVGGFFIYNYVMSNRNAIQAVAAANEKSAASSAVDGITLTCTSFAVDSSNPGYGASFSFTFGVSNPSKYPMDSTWTLRIDYTGAGVILSSSQTFPIAAQGVAYPKWHFTITQSQAQALASASDKSFTGSFDRSYTVHGTYGTYDLTRHDTFDSSTGSSTGTGSTGSSGSLQSCPTQ